MPDGAESTTLLYPHAYVINSQTPHPEAAWRWIAFLSERMDHRLIPARESLAQSDAYDDLVGEDTAAIARAFLEKGAPFSPQKWNHLARSVANVALLNSALGKVVEGDSTAEEAMQWAQEQIPD